MNDKNRKKGKLRILCWILAAMMILTGVNVQAAVFEAPVSDGSFSGGEFSSGEDAVFQETTDAAAEPVETEEGSIQPGEAAEPLPDTGGGEEENAENPENTEEVTSTGDSEVFRAAAEIGSPVTILFADAAGKNIESLTMTSKIGESIILPAVPGYENVSGSGWKLDRMVDDSEAVVESGRSSFKLDPAEEFVIDHIVNGVLTFYLVEGTYTVNFYNNSGTGNPLKTMKVNPGTSITLPDVPNSKYVNFGWTTAAKSTTVKYKIGASYTVNANTNLYIVRYSTSRVKTVTFLGPTGATSSAFKALTIQAVSGTKITLPEVPGRTGYACLGWSTKKNAKSATYAAGKSITVKKNLTFYAVRQKLPTYTVKFNNNSGTSTSSVYTSLAKKIYRGYYVTLPAVPTVKGYQNLGWTTTKKGTTAQYTEGSKVKVTKNMTFYAVRKKAVYYITAFYSPSGTSDSAYAALRQKTLSGTSIKLPSIPAREGYVNLGWSTKKNASTAAYKEGAVYKVTKHQKLYAVQKKEASVILHKNDGTVWRTYKLAEGSSLTLPGTQNATNYTMMGWSQSPRQSVNPTYEVGETLKDIKGTVKLYAVVFDRRTETDYSADDLPQVDLRKYKQVIFVGDSRTNRMANTLEAMGNTGLTSGMSFIYKEGGGLTWFKSEGYASLLRAIGDGSNGILSKKTLIVFNLGVNDLDSSYSYVTYMRSIAEELRSKGCVLYYMSVNPVNNEMIKALGVNSPRTEAAVRGFNAVIRTNLCSGSSPLYTYIDTYSYLMKNGYGTDRNREGGDEGVDDGLHYTAKTYKRIYRYCMEIICQQ